MISVTPSSQSLSVGSLFNVDLVVSELATGSAPSLGAFDLYFNFNPANLSFVSASFGDATLGDQLDLAHLGSLTATTPESNRVQLFELSFDSVNDLNNLQADTFRLATLSFIGLSQGSSPLAVTLNAVSDANGDALDLNTQGGGVTINAVPVPAAWLMFVSGVLFLRRLHKKQYV